MLNGDNRQRISDSTTLSFHHVPFLLPNHKGPCSTPTPCPLPLSVEKLSFTKPVPGTKKVETADVDDDLFKE